MQLTREPHAKSEQGTKSFARVIPSKPIWDHVAVLAGFADCCSLAHLPFWGLDVVNALTCNLPIEFPFKFQTVDELRILADPSGSSDLLRGDELGIACSFDGTQVNMDETIVVHLCVNLEKTVLFFVKVRDLFKMWRLCKSAYRVIAPSMILAS